MHQTICAWSFLSGKVLNYEFNICSRCRTFSISFSTVKLFSSTNVSVSFLCTNWQKIWGGFQFSQHMVSVGVCILFNFLNNMVILKTLRATFKVCVLDGSVYIYYLNLLIVSHFFLPSMSRWYYYYYSYYYYLLSACHFREYVREAVDHVTFTESWLKIFFW